MTNWIEFSLSLLNVTLVWGYLAIFDFEISPDLRITITVLILFRILLCILSSIAVYYGLRGELVKLLGLLGTDMKAAKTMRQMVSRIEDGDLQLQVMG